MVKLKVVPHQPQTPRLSVTRSTLSEEQTAGAVEKYQKQLESHLKQKLGNRPFEVSVTFSNTPGEPASVRIDIKDFDPRNPKDVLLAKSLADPKLNIEDVFTLGGRTPTNVDSVQIGKMGDELQSVNYYPPSPGRLAAGWSQIKQGKEVPGFSLPQFNDGFDRLPNQ